MFKPLTKEQYNSAINSGFNHEEILSLEQQRRGLEEEKPGRGGVAGVAVGAGKELLGTVRGAAGLGERLLRGTARAVLPKRAEEALGIADREEPTGAEQLIPEEAVTPEGFAEKLGAFLTGVATLAVPQAAVLKGVKAAPLVGKIAAEAGFGAGVTAISRGKVDKETVKGAALGAAFPVAGKALGAVGKALTEALPKRFIRSAIRQPKKEILAGKDVSDFVLKNKKIGTHKSLLENAEVAVVNLSEDITKRLSSVRLVQNKITNNSLVDRVVKNVNEQGGQIDVTEVRNILNRLAPQSRGLLSRTSMTVLDGNKLRQSLDKTLGDRGFLTAQLPFNKEILRTFANTLREEVKEKAPKGTRELFDELSKEIRLRNVLLDTSTQASRNQIISFGDLIGGGLGTAAGGPAGALAGVIGRRILQSAPFLTASGVGLSQLKQLQGVVQTISPEIRALLLELLQATGDED